MVKFVNIVTTFCSVCFVSALDETHKIKDAINGEYFRAFNCGRRGQKTELLRYENKVIYRHESMIAMLLRNNEAMVYND